MALSPEALRVQSRQNLSDMSHLIDTLYNRADTPAAREALATMTKAVNDIKPTGCVMQATLDVEKLLKDVLRDYNKNLDENTADGVDTATVSIIKSIVSTRKKMCLCNIDADFKRGFKSYRKQNKGVASKKDLKKMYEDRYNEVMAEADGYVKQAKTLEQLVKSYQLQTRELNKQQELDELNATIQKLAAKYKKSTDQAERDRLNTEYQTLLRKKQSLDAALLGYKKARGNVATVEALLGQLTAQADVEQIDDVSLDEFNELANSVTAGIKRATKRNNAIDEAYGAVASATENMLNRAGNSVAAGPTLDSVVLNEHGASLDDIVGDSAAEASINASLDDLIGKLDD